MRRDSFRVRLTLWNVAVLALVLGGFGLTLCYSVQNWMGWSIDRELAERAHRSALRGFRMRPMPGRRVPAQRVDAFGPRERTAPGAGPQALGRERGRPGERMGPPVPGPGVFPPPDFPRPRPEGMPAAPPERGPQGSPFDAEAERRASFLRPRFLDLHGQGLPPFSTRGAWDPSTVADGVAGNEPYSTIEVGGERVRVFTTRWYRGGQIGGALQVARDMGEYDRLWQGLVWTLLALLPLSLLVAGMGGLFLTDRALRPVHQVTQAAAQIGVEDLSRRLKVHGRDELAQLAATFNGMIARLEAAFEQQRRFTADASHELRTPLARIKVTTSMALADEQSPEEYQTALRIADQAADAMERLIQQLLLLARADAGQLPIERSDFDLRCVLEEAADTVACLGPAPLTLDLPREPIEMSGDADHLCRVFVNLLENALRHTPAEGQVTLQAGVEGHAAVVRVTDTGEGISPEHLPYLGERFYRVDAARTRRTGGCGLGLAISRTIVQAHGGELSIASEVGRGTEVTVSLPLSGPSDQASG
jgi:two-component system OmpR family sensor kinase